MGFRVENPGIQTTIQDEGRFGYQQYGVSVSGPMDTESFCIANILVGNSGSDAGLEITYMGPTLVFDEDNVIAVTGGHLSPMLNGELMPMYRAVKVKSGDRLVFGGAGSNGCRAYVAFAGGLDVPEVMGSRATLLRNSIGGIDGRKLEKGDEVKFLSPKSELADMDKRAVLPREYPKKEVVLRVIPGPQDDRFTEDELRKFFWYSAEICNESDRMGYRLKREIPVKHKTDGNIITDGIAFGSIQVPSDGQPIIMMADRQSTGGYTKIGTVITVDLPKLAQAMPGYRVRFVRVGIDLAQQLYLRRQKWLEDLDREINGKAEQ